MRSQHHEVASRGVLPPRWARQTQSEDSIRFWGAGRGWWFLGSRGDGFEGDGDLVGGGGGVVDFDEEVAVLVLAVVEAGEVVAVVVAKIAFIGVEGGAGGAGDDLV